MSKTLIIAATIALNSALIPITAHAATSASAPAPASASTTSETNTPTEMSKDSWLGSMTPMLPDLICKGFLEDADLKKRFGEIHMDYKQCTDKIPPISTKCQNQLYAGIPDKINSESAAIWGKSIGECIGKNFAEEYLIPK